MLLENRITNIILLHLVLCTVKLSLNNYATLQVSLPAADFVVLIHEAAAVSYTHLRAHET